MYYDHLFIYFLSPALKHKFYEGRDSALFHFMPSAGKIVGTWKKLTRGVNEMNKQTILDVWIVSNFVCMKFCAYPFHILKFFCIYSPNEIIE